MCSSLVLCAIGSSYALVGLGWGWVANEKHFFFIMMCFELNWRLSPLCQTRRGEIERPLPESGVDAYLTLSRHLFIAVGIYL